MDRHILTLSCADRLGIVAALTGRIAARGGNLVEVHQYNDVETGRYFSRFDLALADPGVEADLRRALGEEASRLDADWAFIPAERRMRVLVMVSRFDHCLVDMLYRMRIGELPVEIVAIVSNHPRESIGDLSLGGIPFHHVPVERADRGRDTRALLDLVKDHEVELVVLARYMQVLTAEAATALAGRCINIHHSFLPGFKGAKPYHQAHARGVKLIGATAHYVTPDLDEGPIIEQDVERVGHHHDVAELLRKGRDIERRVLARAVAAHATHRTFLNGTKVVVLG